MFAGAMLEISLGELVFIFLVSALITNLPYMVNRIKNPRPKTVRVFTKSHYKKLGE